METYLFLSKLLPELSSLLSPESPSSPNTVISTLASVPAVSLLPVITCTMYVWGPGQKKTTKQNKTKKKTVYD